MIRRYPWIINIFLFTLLWIGFGDATAQTEIDHWLRFDVNLTLQQNSTLAVEEIHEVALANGTTTFQRVIPTHKLEKISNFQILQVGSNGDQHTYQPANTKAEYTFEVIVEPDQQIIQLYFPSNNSSSTRFILRYFVTGTLRFYDSGDRLDWQPLGERTTAPIARSTTVINLPVESADEQIVGSSSGIATNKFLQNASKATFVATDIAANSELEVSVTFPHGLVQGTPPSWQREVDGLEFWTPKLQWGSALLGLVILLVGLLGAYSWWYLRIRVSLGPRKLPTYLTILPDNLPPAMAGALLDGHANPKHILATLLDMAYHGAFHVDNGSKGNLLLEGKQEQAFCLYAVDQIKVTQPYEAVLYSKIFGSNSKKQDLANIRETLFMSTPELKHQIDAAITQAGYLQKEGQVKRRQYMAFGGAGVVMSLVLALLVSVLLQQYTYLVACPFLGIAASAAAFIAAGLAITSKTKVGAKETARWEAFKRFLHDMSPQEAEKHKQLFAHWLPYAVAFGLEKDFVKKFATANAPKPKWWGQPKEKLLDLSPDQAYTWISPSVMESGSSPKSKAHSKEVIRRLGQPNGEALHNDLLKHIQPALVAFLKAGCEAFSQVPIPDEDKGVEMIR